MVGQLLDEAGAVVAELSDAGEWSAPDADYEPLAALLNADASPFTSYETGDQRLPFGVSVLNRAGLEYGYTPKLAQPIPPLPEGAVS